jgi:hypothetical protein
MLNKEPLAEDAIREALKATGECPGIEELEALASGQAPPANNLTQHLQACTYCQTELHLLKTFLAPEAGGTREAGQAAERLRGRSREIFRQAFPTRESTPWWKAAFTMRRMAQASLAMAALLLVVATVVFLRSTPSRPQLEARNQTAPDVLRSGSFAVLSPAGDLRERPKEIVWQKVPQTASYQVRLLAVDRSEIWKATTADARIELPAAAREQIVPAKTLFAEITAFDSSGNQVGTTGLVRFRLLPGTPGH